MHNALPKVLLFGCTNVGKSTLFNRLSLSRMAIVHDRPGVTRDFLSATVDEKLQLMDSGGLGRPNDSFANLIEERVKGILGKIDVIVWVLDGKCGLTARDHQISHALRKLNKPIILAVNKIDNERDESGWAEFYHLGWEVVIPIAAEHTINIAILKEAITHALPSAKVSEGNVDLSARFAVIGRPNVGKSSLVNALLKEDRMLVSDVAGTTRDAVECPFSWQFKMGQKEDFILVDTAGIRKKIVDPVEYYAYVRTEKALQTVDLSLVLLDLLEGPTVIDKDLVRYVYALGKACIWVVNKWDIARQQLDANGENAEKFQNKFLHQINSLYPFFDTPVAFVSAKSGEGIDALLRQVTALHQRLHTTVSTGLLNRYLHKITAKVPPTSYHGKHFKIYYAVQIKSAPFTLRVFCNKLRWMPNHYQRFLENSLRQQYALKGCPIVWQWVEKSPNTALNALPLKQVV
ncbi:MAG: ribosome biogenesis GTPase Der [Puniceicoccales bacterium]|jgi:GTP-binding protein|nr:ribosome biogenesis GTPase Der [Puniceicoccales bacterium]